MSHLAATYEDAFNLLAGDLIGSGMTRKVFRCNIDKSLVVKVEDANVRSHFQNMLEWFVWNRVCGTTYEKWFAPVVEISPNGRILLMKRTQTCDLPDKMPAFFTDFKRENYGMYNKHVVCHDYGSNLLMEVGMTSKLVKARWDHAKS